MTLFVRIIAKHTKSLTGQLLLEQNPENYSYLAENKNLHEQVWLRIYESKPGAGTAEKLMGHQLPSSCVDLVVSKEKRVGVLKELVSYNYLTKEQGKALINKTSTYSKIARTWWLSGKVPQELKNEVALDACAMLEYAL